MPMMNQFFSFFIILTTFWLIFFDTKINIKDHPIINEFFSLFIIAACFLVFFNKKRTFKEKLFIAFLPLCAASRQYSKFFISESTNKFSDNLSMFVFIHSGVIFFFLTFYFKKNIRDKIDRDALNDYYFWGPIFLLIVQLVLYTSKYQWALISFAIWAVYSLLFSLLKKTN